MRVRKAALLFHAFYTTSGEEGPDLEAIWRGAQRLGLRDRAGPYPVELPTTIPEYAERLVVLAAARRSGVGVHQALAFHQQDLVGVSVVLAPALDPEGWIGLDRIWRQAVPNLSAPGLIGSVTEYIGLSPYVRPPGFPRRLRSHATPASIGHRLRQQVPGSDGNWPTWWSRGGPGALVWELPTDSPAVGAHRRLLVLGGATDEDALDRWLWSSDSPGLVPFTRYLIHAAKLRHQSALLTGSIPGLRRACGAVETACDLLHRHLNDASIGIDGLVEADQTLSRVQTERTGLIAALADVRAMARTVEAARLNMVEAIPHSAADPHCGPFAIDRQIAQWTVEQLRSEEIYLSATQQRAEEVGRVTGQIVTRELSNRQEKLTLLQTSIIGSLLMALAGVQAFQYVVPVSGPLLAPLLVNAATLALVLPIAVSSWSRGNVPRGRWRLVNAGLLALLGAGSGWLATTATTSWALGRAAGPNATLPAAVFCALLAAAWCLVKSRASRP